MITRSEFVTAKALIGIPDRLVIVDDTAEFAWCVAQAEDGMWEVFWMERGNKNELERFATEDQACGFMLGRLAYTQILAGMRYGGTASDVD